MKNFIVSLANIAAIFAPVRADMAIFCSLNSNPELFKSYRDFDFYKSCGEDCSCSAFELMCLYRNVDETTESGFSVSLESTNFATAEECTKTASCICNYNEKAWASASDNLPSLNGQNLPHHLLVPIVHYPEMKKEAERDTTGLEKAEIDEITYKKNILSELSGGHTRVDKSVAHPLNESTDGHNVNINDAVPLITDGCEDQIICDLHYELDWDFRLRAPLKCERLADDPCFGTFACMCDNGYVRIATIMPERPAEYTGIVDALAIVEDKIEV